MWSYFFVLLWVMYMLSAGIHIFSRGFLLSRQTLKDVNDCIPMEFCDDPTNGKCLHGKLVESLLGLDLNQSLSRICFPAKSKVILVVIDALKYEFGLHDESIENPRPYQNRMPVFQKYLKESPQHTRFTKFVADPPTTTLQRLKAMTTGSLPTFIDVGSNFDTPEINEDNIIDQLVRHNRKIVFSGDSTWTELYPNRFLREHAYPSFNIYDLDTVDRGVLYYLPDEMRRRDWNLFIMHYLGVDHCGHKYGPHHSEMSRKLGEMNDMIEEIIYRMDEKTTLIVIGDHGMTSTGDHGGDSPDELNSLLFAYSKKFEFHGDNNIESMRQIDIVPTLSILLGVPIPFSNLGQINYNIIPKTVINYFTQSTEFLFYALQNVWQMRYYQQRIVEESPGLFTDQAITEQNDAFHFVTLKSMKLPGAEIVRSRYHEEYARPYLNSMHSEFSTIWIKFDGGQMLQGLLFVSIFSWMMFLLIENVPVMFYSRIFTTERICFVYISNFVLAALSWVYHRSIGFDTQFQGIVVTTSIFNMAMIACAVTGEFEQIVETLKCRKLSPTIIMTRAVFVFSVAVFFSNSFIVQEQYILSYAIKGVLCLLLYRIQKTHMRFNARSKLNLRSVFDSMFVKLLALTIVAIGLTRVSQEMFRCREEQGNCTEFTAAPAKGPEKYALRVNNYEDLMPIILFALFVTSLLQFLKHMNNLQGFRFTVLVAKFGPPAIVVCIGSHFALSRRGHYIPLMDSLAWFVYACCAVQLGTIIFSPLLVKVGLDSYSSTVTHLYTERVIQNGHSNNEHKQRTVAIPWTEGLRGAYSATFIVTGLYFAMLVALLLGPSASSGIVVTFVVAAAILFLATVLRFQTARSLEKCLHPEFLTLFAWSLLAHYSFFATSHQPTLSQIDWHSAFVGRRNPNIQHNGYISALLVLINTFGGHIVVFIMYPLLCIFGFGLYARFSSLIPKPYVTTYQRLVVNLPLPDNGVNNVLERLHHFELRRGDLNLYEKEHALTASVFRTGCQLMVLQGFRIFCCMLACTIHCRHLMVWKIFAPRFIFEGLASYLSFGAIVLAYLILVRVHTAISNLFGRIVQNKELLDRITVSKRNIEEEIQKHLQRGDTLKTNEPTEPAASTATGPVKHMRFTQPNRRRSERNAKII